MFLLLGLAGGALMIILDSAYYIFALPKLENDKKGFVAAGAVIWYFVIIIFVYFPYADYCVHTVLNSSDENVLSTFREFVAFFLIAIRIYWYYRHWKKMKEIKMKNASVG